MAEPIPDPTLPRYPVIVPRPFNIEIDPRIIGLPPKDMNIHVRTQTEGTDGNEWVTTNVSVKTLCWRRSIFVGAFDQASPDPPYTEIYEDIEEVEPDPLISVMVSNLSPV